MVNTQRILVLCQLLWLNACSTEHNLHWVEGPGYRSAALQSSSGTRAGFQLKSPESTGVTFQNRLTRDLIQQNRVLLNGSGLALGDFDADGKTDIYLCGIETDNALYKNIGDWRFEDVTASAGVAMPGQFAAGAVFADIDGDRDLDLLVTTTDGTNACFLNNGDGTFTDGTAASGIRDRTGATTIALGDIDGDADLDLYIANYKKRRAQDIFTPQELAFDNVVVPDGSGHKITPRFQSHYALAKQGTFLIRLETGEPDMLYLNDGTGRFTEASFLDGRFQFADGHPENAPADWGLMVRMQSVNGDRAPDLYICNDFESPDRFWINDGQGNFHEVAPEAMRHTSNSSMAVDFSDIDRDGDLDFIMVDMLSRDHARRMRQMLTGLPKRPPPGQIFDRPEYMRNALMLNRGDSTYAEIARYSGLEATEWTWSTVFLDIDFDGYEDLIFSTGAMFDLQDLDTEESIRRRARMGVGDARKMLFQYPALPLTNLAYRNRGDLRFEDRTDAWGFAGEDISQGMATADFDSDGDLDLVVNRLNAPAALYENLAEQPRIAVRLNGESPNTQGIGARITVAGGPVEQTREVISGGLYLAGADPIHSFAASGENRYFRIRVEWRDGSFSRIDSALANRIYEIDERASEPSPAPSPEPRKKIGSSSRDGAALFRHREASFDDFRRQPLLPRKLSRSGPGLAATDLNGDRLADLLVTNGRGAPPTLLMNGVSGLTRQAVPAWDPSHDYEQTGIVATPHTGILIAHANYESEPGAPSFVVQYRIRGNSMQAVDTLRCGASSLGPLALADTDGDGDLDLFAGGTSIPGSFPAPAASYFFENVEGSFELDTTNTGRMRAIGLVSGAVFSDIDSDGDPDLALATQWGPVRIWENSGGNFRDATLDWGLSEITGLWNGVNAGDFNGDGRPDLVATNWGLNAPYRATSKHPLKLFYGDFDVNGVLDIIEAYHDTLTGKLLPVRGMNALSNAVPHLRIRIATHEKYGRASLSEILGPKLQEATELHATWLESSVFLNRERSFRVSPLPPEAQFSPAFHAGITDIDADGHEDVFISQNFFAYHHDAPRSDAGRGLWLGGDGKGNFAPVPGRISGVRAYGEQRAAPIADLDGDTRPDLIVGQNAADLHIVRAAPETRFIRIRLEGGDANPLGIGATVRLKRGESWGATRELHCGAGYLTQDEPAAYFAAIPPPTAVRVRWPDGSQTESEWPARAQGVFIQSDGQLRVE